MAEFKTSYDKTAKWEGGYVNNPKDRGGETYFGVSRKYHPNWKGWAIVDKYKPLKHNQKIDSLELRSEVKVFYYHNFWQPIQGDFIEKQHIADIIYDWHVNSGKSGLKSLQKAIGVKADGIIGSNTLKAINNTSLCTILEARESFYKSIVKKDPTQEVFLQGWLNRLNDFN